MLESLFYVCFAFLGVSFLIFIHELGHYLVARALGIRVETFAIGFGKAIYTWERNGETWQIGIFPFGGYVKMAGMDDTTTDSQKEPDSFFSRPPAVRMAVAVAGPVVNIVFALCAFSAIWFLGGREKPFGELTNYVGWVSTNSLFYDNGIRPGDQITHLDQTSFQGLQDLLKDVALNKEPTKVSGEHINFSKQEKWPFSFSMVKSAKQDLSIQVAQIFSSLAPATYLFFDQTVDLPPFPPSSSILGLERGDRLVWADGQLVFSARHLSEIINAPFVLLSVKRGKESFLSLVPRLYVKDLFLDRHVLDELDDWRFLHGLRQDLIDLFFIPYQISMHGEIIAQLPYVDDQANYQTHYIGDVRQKVFSPLQAGDVIVGVQGTPVRSGFEILLALQEKFVSLIVEKQALKEGSVPLEIASKGFFTDNLIQDVAHLESKVGFSAAAQQQGALLHIPHVAPIRVNHSSPPPAVSSVDKNEDPSLEPKSLEGDNEDAEISPSVTESETVRTPSKARKDLWFLGIMFKDQAVTYNPHPWKVFGDTVQEMGQTMKALVQGHLSPKNMMGPVGVVDVVQRGWSEGAINALFWIGMISLNLGLFNLLPLPVLDGGYIFFGLLEIITGKRLSPKTMENFTIPFVIFLLGLFVYVTYHDLLRIFNSLL